MILSEFSRIMDHFVCIGTNVVDLGAITPFFVLFRAREDIYDLLEACCGARLTVSYVRIGGLAADVPEDFEARCRAVIDELRGRDHGPGGRLAHPQLRSSSAASRTWARCPRTTRSPGAGWGPACAAPACAYDIRKDHPYSGYEQYDFDVPVGTVGDCYDRYLVRMEEIRQSLRIIEQALREAARRAGDRGRQARGPAAEVRGLQQHRSPHEPLQAGLRGDPAAAGRGLRLHRGRQRRARATTS